MKEQDKLSKAERLQAHKLAYNAGGLFALLALVLVLIVTMCYYSGFTGLVGGLAFALVIMRLAV